MGSRSFLPVSCQWSSGTELTFRQGKYRRHFRCLQRSCHSCLFARCAARSTHLGVHDGSIWTKVSSPARLSIRDNRRHHSRIYPWTCRLPRYPPRYWIRNRSHWDLGPDAVDGDRPPTSSRSCVLALQLLLVYRGNDDWLGHIRHAQGHDWFVVMASPLAGTNRTRNIPRPGVGDICLERTTLTAGSFSLCPNLLAS